MRKLNLIVLAVVLVASLIAVAQGRTGGYFWGGLALLGIIGQLFVRQLSPHGAALRIYSVGFCLALLGAAVLCVVLATTSGPERRGPFIGLSILTFVAAGASIAIVIAVERQRGSQERPRT